MSTIAMSTVVISNIIRILALTAVAATAAGCWPYGNEGAQYFHRTDTITTSAGNAKDTNAAVHVIDPWPRQVGNRRIPANGDRMVGAMQRYQGKQTGRAQTPAGASAGPADASTPASGPPAGVATPTLR
jgi:hypothetical protein